MMSLKNCINRVVGMSGFQFIKKTTLNRIIDEKERLKANLDQDRLDKTTSHYSWTYADITDVSGPALAVRNYYETRDLKKCLNKVSEGITIKNAADIGAGYGRLSLVLKDFAHHVTGFERESAMLEDARKEMPEIHFVNVKNLYTLPAKDGFFDFAMTFTVLQHLSNKEMMKTIAEIKRIVATGYILLAEETDANHISGDPLSDIDGISCTVGRSVETYKELMKPFELVMNFKRSIEPTYERKDTGDYMLFKNR